MEARHFDDEFEEAVAEWRSRHRLAEDDAVLLLVELFRLHQRHWDEIRRRELPSFDQVRSDIARLSEAARTFRTDSAALPDILRSQRDETEGDYMAAAGASRMLRVRSHTWLASFVPPLTRPPPPRPSRLGFIAHHLSLREQNVNHVPKARQDPSSP